MDTMIKVKKADLEGLIGYVNILFDFIDVEDFEEEANKELVKEGYQNFVKPLEESLLSTYKKPKIEDNVLEYIVEHNGNPMDYVYAICHEADLTREEALEYLSEAFMFKYSDDELKAVVEEYFDKNSISNLRRTEYAIEIYNKDDGFDRQLDVLNSYEEAKKFVSEYDEPLEEGQYIGILAINYDEDGDEAEVERL